MNTGQRAVIYTRISQDRSGEGLALERQESECRRLTEYKRYDVIGVISDTISASTGKRRPGWEKVLELVRAGQVDVVVAYHLDRITRSMSDLEELILLCEEHSVSVDTKTGDIDLTTDTGRMVSRILAAVARQEVERKAARQKAASKQRAEQGEMWRGGWRPFGYDVEGNVIEDEAQAIREAVTDFLAGAVEIKEIAKRWDALELKPTSGREGAWNLPTVRNILKRATYAGLRDYDGTEYVGNWEAIITPEQHYEIRAKLDDPARRVGGNPGGRHPVNLLTSIGVCKNGHPVRSASVRGRPVYSCRKGCVTVTKADADALVLNSIAMSVQVMAPGTLLPAYSGADAGALELERDGLLSRYAQEAAKYNDGLISELRFETVTADVERKLAVIEKKLSNVATVPVEQIQKNALDRFDGMSLRQQRDMLYSLSTELVILSPGRGRRNVNPRELMLMSVTTLAGRDYAEGEEVGPLWDEDGNLIREPKDRREPRRICVLEGPHKTTREALAHIDEILSEAE